MTLIPVPRHLMMSLPALLAAKPLLAAEQAAAAAAGAQPAKAPFTALSPSQDPMAMASLWQLTLGMLVVLGLILAIAWLLKRSGRFQMAAGGGLRVLGGLSMGSRERVVLIQAGETQLLLGVAPGRVQTLHVLDRPLQPQQGAVTTGFAEQLGRILGKGKA
jgi:flagellar protein FliO/FliZ